MMEDVIIRRFEEQDRQAVRESAWDTAFIGEPADAFFQGKDILSDFLTGYFTDYEPGACFVAESEGKVVGYLIASENAAAMAETFAKKILAGLMARFIFSGAVFRPKNLRMIMAFFLSLFKGEFKMAEIGNEYPAALHINIIKEFRGSGTGSRLIKALEEYLRSRHTVGMHLATMSASSGEFFRQQGFTLLHRYPRSYFRHILGRDIIVYVYGKKLSPKS